MSGAAVVFDVIYYVDFGNVCEFGDVNDVDDVVDISYHQLGNV